MIMIMIIINMIGLSLLNAVNVTEYHRDTACGLGYSMPSVLSSESFLKPARLFVVKIPCNMAFPTVSASLQILSKLFPVHQLLLG